MVIKQLSVFVENQPGKLAEITGILKKNAIDIRALCIADTTDFGILRLIVSDPDRAEQLLRQQGFTVSITGVIGVGVLDRPGGLADVLQPLSDAGIAIEYMYAYVSKSERTAFVVLRVVDTQRALETLQKNGVTILDEAY